MKKHQRGQKIKSSYEYGSKEKYPASFLKRSDGYFDTFSPILSRVYNTDREQVIQRAFSQNMTGIIFYVPDIEKLNQLAQLCQDYIGFSYFVSGIHPDNIDRSNKKLHDAWLLKVDENCRNKECVGIMSGLNLNQQLASQFAQETMLREMYRQAGLLNMPLILYLIGTQPLVVIDKVYQILLEEGWDSDNGIPVVINNASLLCNNNINTLRHIMQCNFHVSLSYPTCDSSDGDSFQQMSEFLREIPINRLIIGTCTTHNTPQNIPDEYIRHQKNEPSNVMFIYQAIYEHLLHPTPSANLHQHSSTGTLSILSEHDFCRLIFDNCKKVYRLHNMSVTVTSTADVTNTMGAMTLGDSYKEGGVLDVNYNSESVSLHGVNILVNESDDNAHTDDTCAHIHIPSISTSYFVCTKCSSTLFNRNDIIFHNIPSSLIDSKVDSSDRCSGTYDVCSAYLYLSLTASHGKGVDFFPQLTFHVTSTESNQDVACGNCNSKIGKYFKCTSEYSCVDGAVVAIAVSPTAMSVSCPCGWPVVCPVIRIVSSKVKEICGGDLDDRKVGVGVVESTMNIDMDSDGDTKEKSKNKDVDADRAAAGGGGGKKTNAKDERAFQKRLREIKKREKR